MYLLATPASVPTETALLLPLKDTVPGLDKYLFRLCLGNLLMAWQFLDLKRL